jgi:hypothetical protein
MGLFFHRRKNIPIATIEVSAEYSHSYISDKDMLLLKSGWKRDLNGVVHPPDTVWVRPRSHVYHHMDFCQGGYFEKSTSMTEMAAERLGLRRCSKCDWDYIPFP